MESLHKLFYLSLLFCSCSFGQTVFITSDKERPKEKKEDKIQDGSYKFIQHAFSLSFRANPDAHKVDEYTQEKGSWFLPDGFSYHAGYGTHLNNWLGISLNTGIDTSLNEKLVAVPIYGSLFLNPHFNEDSSVLFQVGFGQSFALGRGDLSGFYQKYRLGIVSEDELCFFVDLSFYGYSPHNINQTSTISLGISLFNFF